METATTRVLDTYELLEAILVEIPLRKLFTVQRVCRTWEILIEQSHQIQKKMFLMADGEPVRPNLDKEHTAVNTLPYSGHIRLNPAIDFRLHAGAGHLKVHHSSGCGFEYRILRERQSLVIELYPPTFERVINSHTSKMLLTQPPVTSILFSGSICTDLGPGRGECHEPVWCTIYNPAGLTFSDILLAEPYLQKHGGGGHVLQYGQRLCKQEELRSKLLSFHVRLPLVGNERAKLSAECKGPPRRGDRSTCACIEALFD